MQRTSKDYPVLDALMSGWFHQDFDIEGETIEEIIGAYKDSCSQEELKSIAAEINKFLGDFEDNTDEEFSRIFKPDVDPKGFSPTTREFLKSILSYL